MTQLANLLAVAAAVGASSPVAAQYSPYPNQPGYNYPAYPGQSYPGQTYPGQTYPDQTYPGQTYPGQTYPGQTYPGQSYPGQTYPGYGYNQGYGGNPVADIIDQLLGNRYSVTDRQAVRQCARAATDQARSQFGGYPNRYGGYGNGYGYNQGVARPSFRVSSITNVEHRSYGLRVQGTLTTGYAGQYGNGYAYQGPGDVGFRCNVDYRGVVTDVRVGGYGRAY